MEIRSILKFPVVYETYQRLVGGTRMRDECLQRLALQPGHRVLDLGCGPAYYLAQMPDVEYHGFDTDETYIAHARRKFGGRGTFHCELFTAETAERLGGFDRIMLLGLLHHLDDQGCSALLSLLARCLEPDGVAIALDTAVHPRQSRVERALAEGDRGEHVRSPEGFSKLARQHFGAVEGSLPSSFWVPSIYWVMTMKEPVRGEDG